MAANKPNKNHANNKGRVNRKNHADSTGHAVQKNHADSKGAAKQQNFEIDEDYADHLNMDFLNIDSLKSMCMKYRKYIAAGAAMILLAAVAASSCASSAGSKNPNQGTEKTSQGGQALEEFKMDEYPQINALMEQYYGYYASGDVEALEKIAYPLSDTEKSYIQLFSQYIDSYENIKCYTKKGIHDDEFIVSAAVDMKFKNIGTAQPELKRFYIRKDESGAYYIDNAYSQFNQSNKENMTDEKINARMAEYEQEEDVAALQKQIQEDYDKAIAADSDLENMVKDTLQDVMSDWVASFGTKTDNAGKTGTDNKNGEESGQKQGRTAYTSTKVNLRKKRSTGSSIIQVLKKGTEVTVYGDSKDGWYEVKANGNTGYVSDEYIVLEKPVKPADQNNNSNNSTKEQKRTAYAKTAVNLRKKRSTDSGIIKTLKAGTKLTVYGDSKDGWYKVKVNGSTGYVSDKYIVSDKSEVKKEEDTRTAYAKTEVNLRKGRSTNSKVLKTLKAGTKVTVYGKSQGGWYKVKAKGKTGYIKDDYIVSDKSKVKKGNNDGGRQEPSHYYSEGDQVRLSETVNVRSSMSQNAERLGMAYQGEVVTVIMSYAEGWTKVDWNGQTGYIKTEYLR